MSAAAARKPVHAKHRPGIRKANMPSDSRIPKDFPSELRLKDTDVTVIPHKQVIANQLEEVRQSNVAFSKKQIKAMVKMFLELDPTTEEREALLTMVTQTLLDVRPGPSLTKEQETVFQRRNKTA